MLGFVYTIAFVPLFRGHLLRRIHLRQTVAIPHVEVQFYEADLDRFCVAATDHVYVESRVLADFVDDGRGSSARRTAAFTGETRVIFNVVLITTTSAEWRHFAGSHKILHTSIARSSWDACCTLPDPTVATTALELHR